MQQLAHLFATIKFAHTLFALPMALTGMLLATGGAMPPLRTLGLILLCMAAGRSAAMGLNRLIDAAIDARNPRTAGREIPRGVLHPRAVALFVAASSALFLAGAALLNRLTLALAPVALAAFVLYPYTKRFTPRATSCSGCALGRRRWGRGSRCAGRWGRARSCSARPCCAGCRLRHPLLPAGRGVRSGRGAALDPGGTRGRGARLTARALHTATIVLLASLGPSYGLDGPYLAAVAAAALLLVASHWLVRGDLRQIDTAFFTINSWLSVVILAGTGADFLLRRL